MRAQQFREHGASLADGIGLRDMAEPGRALVQIVRLGKAADDPVQPLAPVDRGIGGEGGRGRGGVGRLAVVNVEDAVQLPRDRKSTRLNSSHSCATRMTSSA